MSRVESVIEQELEEIRKRLPGDQLVSCFSSLVRVQLQMTAYKKIIMNMQFPENYPHKVLLVELKSNTLAPKFLEKVEEMLDKELSKYVGQTQIMYAVKFIKNMMENNPFIVCWDEIKSMKENIFEAGMKNPECSASVKLVEKTSKLKLQFISGKYEMSLSLYIPNGYPAEPVKLSLVSSNFPRSFLNVFIGRAEEIARVSTEPPLRPRKNFVFKPKPCLNEIVEFLFKHSVVRYCSEKCPLCKEKCFPEDPEEYKEQQYIENKEHDKLIERVYCGHIYHHGCLDEYMNTPPFEKEGKLCLVCKSRIYHPKWTPDMKLSEARWAHKQAKAREINEVAEFMGVEEFAIPKKTNK
eukprot:Nk52_evm7s78 gene=Nk52_evmTU7s78